MTRTRTVIAISAMGSLFFIDFNFLYFFLQSNVLNQASWFEMAVFGIQIVKTGFALALRSFRDGKPALLVDLYGAEALLIPVILAVSLVAGPTSVEPFLNELIVGWAVGVALAGLPYATFRLGKSMLHQGALRAVLPSSILVAEFGVLFANAAASAFRSQTGLVGVANYALLGEGTIASSDPAVFGALSVTFVSLLLYAVLGVESKFALSRNRALSMAALGTVASLALLVSFMPLSFPAVLILLPPTITVATVTWWFTRAR
jgi:hypothetical protein